MQVFPIHIDDARAGVYCHPQRADECADRINGDDTRPQARDREGCAFVALVIEQRINRPLWDCPLAEPQSQLAAARQAVERGDVLQAELCPVAGAQIPQQRVVGMLRVEHHRRPIVASLFEPVHR